MPLKVARAWRDDSCEAEFESFGLDARLEVVDSGDDGLNDLDFALFLVPKPWPGRPIEVPVESGDPLFPF
jgi:hypothetical protein